MKGHLIPFVSKHRKLLASILWLGAMVVLLMITILSGRGDAGESDDQRQRILDGLYADGKVPADLLQDMLASVASEEDVSLNADIKDGWDQLVADYRETKPDVSVEPTSEPATEPETSTVEPTTQEPTTPEPTTEAPKAVGPNGERIESLVVTFIGPRRYVGDESVTTDILVRGLLANGESIDLTGWECDEIGKVYEAGVNVFNIRYQGLNTIFEFVAADPRESVMDGFKNLGVITAPKYLNVRNAPNMKGKIVGKLYKNSGVDLLEPSADGQWFHIVSNEVDGWINAGFIAVGEEARQLAIENCFPAIKVTAKTLNVRSGPSKKHDIITQISKGSVFVVTGFEGDWIKIDLGSEDEGYVHSDFTDWHYMLPEAVEYTEPEISPIRKQLIDFAMEYLGGTYKYGGTKLGVAVDCSGFTMRVFEHFGYELSRTAAYQLKNNGVPVDFKDMKPGDLIVFWSAKRNCVGHVGIYIGNGKMIHAASEKRGIVIDRYDYMTPIAARNVLGD